MDFQPLFCLDGLGRSSNSFSPSRSMMISVDEQLSYFGNETFRFSDGMSFSSDNCLFQDTSMTLSEMPDPWNDLPMEPQAHGFLCHNSPVCSYFSQESNNVETQGTAPNTRPLDPKISDIYARTHMSAVKKLIENVNSTATDDPFQTSMESFGGLEIDNLDSVDVLDLDEWMQEHMSRSNSSVSTESSTPEIINTEMVPESRSRESVIHSIENRDDENVGNLNSVDDLKVPCSPVAPPAPVPFQTRSTRSALKREVKKSEKYESIDYSSRRPKRAVACEICEKMFPNYSSLKQHMSFHRPQRPYLCEYAGCKKSYKTRSELNRHGAVHIGQRNYKCLKCGQEFLRKQYLKTHLIRHNEGLTWTCGLCAKIFVSEEDLDKHKTTYHNKKEKRLGGRKTRYALY